MMTVETTTSTATGPDGDIYMPTSSTTTTSSSGATTPLDAAEEKWSLLPVIPPPNPHPTRLHGRSFYESLGSPKYILAPMVEHSHLAWRILVSRYLPKPTQPPSTNPTDPSAAPANPPILSYTPMLHSRLYYSTPSYPQQNFPAAHQTLDGSPLYDRPLLAQFCANDSAAFLSSAQLISPYVDGVDLNLGCPQGIARKGRYGSFLQDDWPLISSLISTLHTSPTLPVPITAKIRIFPDRQKTLAYARTVLSSGGSILAVHARTREQKGHNTGLADWSTIRFLRANLPPETVIFANGNILYPGDAKRCLDETGADGVMSAEGCLFNPTGIFLNPEEHPPEQLFPRMDLVAREYLGILRTRVLPFTEKDVQGKVGMRTPVTEPNLTNVKSHLFKLLHCLLPRYPEIRQKLSTSRPVHPRNDQGIDPLRDFEEIVREVEGVVKEELERYPEETVPIEFEGNEKIGLIKVGEWWCIRGGWVGPQRRRMETVEGEGGEGEVVFGWDIPWYRCQPNFRPAPEEAVKRGAMCASALGKGDAPKGEDVEKEGKKGAKEKGQETNEVVDTEKEKMKETETEWGQQRVVECDTERNGMKRVKLDDSMERMSE